MFTAKVINKEDTTIGLKVTVEFTDGIKTVTEEVLPQDKRGFEHWLNSRLESLNTGEQLKAELVVGETVDFSVKPSAPTDVEVWLGKYAKAVRVKQTLVDTGIIVATNPAYVALLKEVKDGLVAHPEYFNHI